MKVYYLEIVSHDVDAVCSTYEETNNVKFSEPDELLGGAKTCTLNDGSIVGVRKPLRDNEDPVVRPYWLVDDIDQAVSKVESMSGVIAVYPMEISGKGKFAIYIQGGNDHGLWQL